LISAPKNGLTKSGQISINGVFLHPEVPETKHPQSAEHRQQRRLSFSKNVAPQNFTLTKNEKKLIRSFSLL
jgi:hypothetical protein